MLDFLKTYFRKRSLRKNSSTTPTGILPLGKIRSYVAIIDAEEGTFELMQDRDNELFPFQ